MSAKRIRLETTGRRKLGKGAHPSDLTVPELRQELREREVPGCGGLKVKADLVAKLSEAIVGEKIEARDGRIKSGNLVTSSFQSKSASKPCKPVKRRGLLRLSSSLVVSINRFLLVTDIAHLARTCTDLRSVNTLDLKDTPSAGLSSLTHLSVSSTMKAKQLAQLLFRLPCLQSLRLHQPLTQQVCSALCRTAHKSLRHLHFAWYFFDCDQTSFWTCLQSLSNLESLWLLGYRSGPIGSVKPLPQVRSLRLSAFWTDVVPVLAAAMPNLTTLSIDEHYDDVDFAANAAAFASLASLRVINSHFDFARFSNLQSLTSLDLSLSQDVDDVNSAHLSLPAVVNLRVRSVWVWDPADLPVFPNLKSLDVDVNADSILPLHSKMPRLESLVISSDDAAHLVNRLSEIAPLFPNLGQLHVELEAEKGKTAAATAGVQKAVAQLVAERSLLRVGFRTVPLFEMPRWFA